MSDAIKITARWGGRPGRAATTDDLDGLLDAVNKGFEELCSAFPAILALEAEVKRLRQELETERRLRMQMPKGSGR